MNTRPSENKQQELKLDIGGVCLLLNITHPEIREKIKSHYKAYISTKKSDIYIDIEYRDFLKKPKPKTLLFQTKKWSLDRQNNRFYLYFSSGNSLSFAILNTCLNRIRFYTRDPSGQLLLYLFPETLFGLVLPKNNGLILHACGVLNKQKAYLFIAPSGGGKSTIARLALEKGMVLLNDDRIIIRREDNSFKVYGNPWHGEIESTSNRAAYIKRFFLLKKSCENYIKPLSKSAAVIALFKNNFHLPVDNDIIKKILNICSDMAEDLDCYTLGFKPDKSIWRFLNDLSE